MPTRIELALLPPSCLQYGMLLESMSLPFLKVQDCALWCFLWGLRPQQLAWYGLGPRKTWLEPPGQVLVLGSTGSAIVKQPLGGVYLTCICVSLSQLQPLNSVKCEGTEIGCIS